MTDRSARPGDAELEHTAAQRARLEPEQVRCAKDVDARTDIYSSGVLLYQLLTGERPFEGGMSAIMHKVLNTEPPLPSQLSVTAPPSLDEVVSRAMVKRPEDRFASAADMEKAIPMDRLSRMVLA